jgi:hypothetical protein
VWEGTLNGRKVRSYSERLSFSVDLAGPKIDLISLSVD